ncbi:MAG: Crp/Fnr family transcriptional regulator [Paludibacteraceae bacterium]|nr:Crp/Fnr family transcriptional regulator [Paludibacteraceae bacterium]
MRRQVVEHFAPLWELNSLWATLTEAERLEVGNVVETISYSKNEIIHFEGDESRWMWMVLRGKVRIYKEGIGLRQQIIRLLKPYDIFGYRACIADEAYNSNASAFEDCVVYRIPRAEFIRLVKANGAFCYEVMQIMAKDLAISEIQTVNLTQKHIRGRLAESLLALVKNYGFEKDEQTLAMVLPREDLANMSNMTTSNAIRTLSQFAQEGLVSLDGKHIRILDEKELAKISRLG